MAVKKFTQKPAVTEYSGMKIGVRQPTTGEMLLITKKRQEYLKTTIDNPYKDGDGEITIFFELQEMIGAMLTCDPDDSSNPWFAENPEDQNNLKKNGVEKDLSTQVPHLFHAKIWDVFAEQTLGRKKEIEEASGTSQSPLPTSQPETTSDSMPSSSELQSTSPAPSETLNPGSGPDSSIASPA